MSGAEIYDVARNLLRTEGFEDQKIRLIGVSVSGFDLGNQFSLFEDVSEQKNKVEEVIADIRVRFGKGSITKASLIKRKRNEL